MHLRMEFDSGVGPTCLYLRTKTILQICQKLSENQVKLGPTINLHNFMTTFNIFAKLLFAAKFYI